MPNRKSAICTNRVSGEMSCDLRLFHDFGDIAERDDGWRCGQCPLACAAHVIK
jgi:hypothetical protein